VHDRVDLAIGTQESLRRPNVAIDVSDPKVDLLDPVVNVEIEIGENDRERLFGRAVPLAPAEAGPSDDYCFGSRMF
jgi:hypothetical protein